MSDTSWEFTYYITPKELAVLSTGESIFRNSGYEATCRKMMELLADADNTFKHVSWDDYDAKYHPDDKQKPALKIQVELISYYFTSVELLKSVCTEWRKAIEDSENIQNLCVSSTGSESTDHVIGEVILPSDLCRLVCSDSVFNHVEWSLVCQNMMQLLAVHGNIFRQLSWDEYKNKYCSRCSDTTLAYVKNQFDDIVPYFASMGALRDVCPSWRRMIDLSSEQTFLREKREREERERIYHNEEIRKQIYHNEIEELKKQKYYNTVYGTIAIIAVIVIWIISNL